MHYSTLVNELEILVRPACKIVTTQKISLLDEMRAFNRATANDVLFALIPFASLIHLSDLTVNICKPAANYLPQFSGKQVELDVQPETFRLFQLFVQNGKIDKLNMYGGNSQSLLIPPLDFDLYKQIVILTLVMCFERHAEIQPRPDIILNHNDMQSLYDYDFMNLEQPDASNQFASKFNEHDFVEIHHGAQIKNSEALLTKQQILRLIFKKVHRKTVLGSALPPRTAAAMAEILKSPDIPGVQYASLQFDKLPKIASFKKDYLQTGQLQTKSLVLPCQLATTIIMSNISKLVKSDLTELDAQRFIPSMWELLRVTQATPEAALVLVDFPCSTVQIKRCPLL